MRSARSAARLPRSTFRPPKRRPTRTAPNRALEAPEGTPGLLVFLGSTGLRVGPPQDQAIACVLLAAWSPFRRRWDLRQSSRGAPQETSGLLVFGGVVALSRCPGNCFDLWGRGGSSWPAITVAIWPPRPPLAGLRQDSPIAIVETARLSHGSVTRLRCKAHT